MIGANERGWYAGVGAHTHRHSAGLSAETYQRGYPPPSRVGLTLSRHRHGSKLAAPEARWMTSSPRQRRGGCKARSLHKGMCDWFAVRNFHLAACQMKLVVFAPKGAAIIEPSRWRFKVSPTRKGGGCPPPNLRLRESRRVAVGRMSAKGCSSPSFFSLFIVNAMQAL